MYPNGMELALGKTIKGFVLKKAAYGTPGLNGQLCIVFSDDTWLEFYSNSPIYDTSGLSSGGMKSAHEYILEHFAEVNSIWLTPEGEIKEKHE